MKIFIIGKNGFIAQKVFNELKGKYQIITTSSKENPESIFLNLETPEKFNYELVNKNDFIIHLAAISSPDVCKNSYDLAYQINTTGALYFLKKCATKGAKVLFFSSDTVYGKTEETFDENSTPEPFGLYAQMKYETEQGLLSESNAKIFRLSYIFAKNDKFTNYLKTCAEKNEPAEIFHPFYRNAVYIQDLVAAIEALITHFEQFDNKIFNICGPELISRKQMAEIFQTHINKKLQINMVTPPEDFFENRPKSISLKSLYFKKLLGREPLTIEKAMQLEFNN